MPYIGKSPSAVGVRNRFYFTASGGETSLSGSDDNGKTLVFSDASYVDVMLNGGNLVSGTDYTATPSTNTISGLTALVANDVVEIIAYDVFSVSDTVSAASGGTFQSNVNFDSGIDVTGNVTVTGTVDGRDVATDGTKLDGIEASADVTDATNVAAAGALMATGGSVTGDVSFGDDDRAIFGAGSDLFIKSDGANALIQGAGTTYIRGSTLILSANGGAGGFETGIRINEVSAETSRVELYYDNSLKLETVSGGIDVTGTAVTDGLTVAGNVSVDGGTIKLDGNYPVGTSNVALGNQALDDGSLSGTDLVAVGTLSLSNNTSGAGNVGIGSLAMLTNTTGNYNTAVGSGQDGFVQGALGLNTSGSSNTAIGYQSLRSNTTASNNTAVGYQAGYSNTESLNLALFGYRAGYSITTGGSNNAFFGTEAGYFNTTAYNNVAIGRQSLYTNSTGLSNVAVGQAALYANTGASNVAVGESALLSNTTSSANTAVGHHAGYYVTGNDNVHLGYIAGRGLSSPGTNSLNVYIGSQVATNQAGSTGNNVAIGFAAAQNLTTTGGNTFAGAYSGQNTTTGWSTGFGYYALQQNTTGNLNTAVGVNASRLNTIGTGNVSMGYQALNNNQTGSYSVAIGYNALVQCTSSYNVAIGTNAGYATTGLVAQTFVGYQAGMNVTNGGNTAVGYNALYSSGGAGAYNTALGQNAGVTQNGAHGVFIGYDSRPGNTGGSHEIVIGTNSATGKGSSTGFIYPSTGGVYQGNNSSTWSTTSDERLKKNIVDNTEGLNKINAIRVRNFEYRTVEEITDTELAATDVVEVKGVQLGVIAQELETVCPNSVKTESTGVKSVDTDNLFWHMLNAIKGLSAKNDALEARIAALES